MKPDYHATRSWLFVPGDSERKMSRAWDTDADALIFDLEDAVTMARKSLARGLTREAIINLRSPSKTVAIRVNAADTGLTEDDISATISCQPDAYVLPKANTPEEIRRVSSLIEAAERQAGLQEGSIALIPIVTEHPAAVIKLDELCRADPRIVAVIWGTEDLSAAMGARRVKDADQNMLDVFRVVRSLVLVAASASGIAIIDTPVVELGDIDTVSKESREAAAMGFTGKLAIHPEQADPINKGFLPSEDETHYAYALLEEAAKTSDGAFRFQGKMIDMPHVRMAERIVALVEKHKRPVPTN